MRVRDGRNMKISSRCRSLHHRLVVVLHDLSAVIGKALEFIFQKISFVVLLQSKRRVCNRGIKVAESLPDLTPCSNILNDLVESSMSGNLLVKLIKIQFLVSHNRDLAERLSNLGHELVDLLREVLAISLFRVRDRSVLDCVFQRDVVVHIRVHRDIIPFSKRRVAE